MLFDFVPFRVIACVAMGLLASCQTGHVSNRSHDWWFDNTLTHPRRLGGSWTENPRVWSEVNNGLEGLSSLPES